MRHRDGFMIWTAAATAAVGVSAFAYAGEPLVPMFPGAIVPLDSLASWTRVLPPNAGDQNRDGVEDLVIAFREIAEVSIALSEGRGRWAPPITLLEVPQDRDFLDLRFADLTRDGIDDLVYYLRDESNDAYVLGVKVGLGDGTFDDEPTEYIPQGFPTGGVSAFSREVLEVGDVTGDGHPDVVVAFRSVVVFPNDGSGGLGPPRIVGSLSRAIELVDADGDGQGEILSASNTGIQLFAFQDGVWTLIGDAPNPLPSTYVMAQTPRFDGAPGRRVYLFYRFDTDATIVSLDIDPDGTMTPGPTARLKSVASNIIAGDFLGGPNLDLLLSDGRAYIDCTRNTFGFPATYARYGFGSIGLGDIDADGEDELIRSAFEGVSAARIVGEFEGRSVELGDLWLTEGFSPGMPGLAMGDFDGDGRLDGVMTSGSNATTFAMYQEPNGSFDVRLVPLTAASVRVSVADLDGDGLDDLIRPINNATAGTRFQINYAEPDRAFAPRVSIEAGGLTGDIAIADLDEDGLVDIVVQTDVGFTVFRQVGPRDFEEGYTSEELSLGVGLDIGDINGDGDLDIVLGGSKAVGLITVLGRGDATFELGVPVNDGGPFVETVDLADLDGDGDLDLVLSNNSGDAVAATLMENDGDGHFVTRQNLVGFESSSFLGEDSEAIDLDLDGDPDIAALADDGMVQIFRNDGAWTFTYLSLVPSEFNLSNQLGVGDLDGDGYPDLLLPLQIQQGNPPVTRAGIRVMRNLGSPQRSCPADLAAPTGILDLADLTAFVGAFVNEEPAADLGARFGVFDLADLVAFVEVFVSGCD